MRKGRGGGVTSLVPRHPSEKLRGVWQHAHTMPCPKEIQSIMQPCANVCIPMQSKLKVCTNAWLDRSINTKIMSVLSGEALASPMSKDCCHATSASNEYTAAWQRDREVEGSARAMRVIV